jgi:hypothetical protein
LWFCLLYSCFTPLSLFVIPYYCFDLPAPPPPPLLPAPPPLLAPTPELEVVPEEEVLPELPEEDELLLP